MYFASVLIQSVNLAGANNRIQLSPVGRSRYDQYPQNGNSLPWIIFDDPKNYDIAVIPQYNDFIHGFDRLSLEILEIISRSCVKTLTAIVRDPHSRPPYIARVYGTNLIVNLEPFLKEEYEV